MFTVLTCIRDDHDLRLVLLAAFICVVSCVTAFRFQDRASHADRAVTTAWTILTGVVAGSGVWATHFIAMVAYHPDAAIQYELGGTAVSGLPAVAGMTLAFALASRWRGVRAAAAAGATAGLGVGLMHYMGIDSVRAALVTWNGAFVAASIAVGLGGGAAAFVANSALQGRWKWVLPPGLLVAAIVGLHFTSMAAVSIIPDASAPLGAENMSRGAMAAVTAGITSLILLSAMILVWMEGQTSRAGQRSVAVAFQAVPNGLALYDADSCLVLWNSAYEQLIGDYGVTLAVGMNRVDILAGVIAARSDGLSGEPAMRTKAETADRRLLDGPQEWRQPDGRWLRVELCPSESGGWVSVMTDVSSLKASAEAMADARDKAEAASRTKSEFLANMSHEIRTPLNGVLGMAQVMEADTLSAQQRERLKVIRESGGVLLAILNDVLDLSKIQAGKMELSTVEFDAQALAGAVRDAFAGSAAAKDIDLMVETTEAAKGHWVGDALRIRQVISNLVSNAIKFSADAPVTIRVDAPADSLVFEVRDHGIGIAKDKIAHLFAAFSQADASMTRRYGGTGLGLSISKDLAELMGGGITVESREGEGSVFTVSLPLPRGAARAAEGAPDASGVHPEEHALTVLAAEDNITNQLVLRALLTPLGISLTVVPDGAQAVAAFEAGVFDAILMDIQMPIMNGIDATRAIRALEARDNRPRVPILALSANVMTHQTAEYLEAGMDGAVAKPIDLKDLVAALERAVSGTAQAQAA